MFVGKMSLHVIQVFLHIYECAELENQSAKYMRQTIQDYMLQIRNEKNTHREQKKLNMLQQPTTHQPLMPMI